MKGNLEIHSENILPIIKKWLYSDRDIFVRELVSNACDACEKLKVLNQNDAPFEIVVRQDREKGTLEFEDNGIGMTADEVKNYISQIAFSGAEEFVKHYKTESEADQLIGHFGLGFYSAYMVADNVEIETLSYLQGSEPVFWSCDGSIEYEMAPGTREKRGTLIRLHLTEDAKEYLEPDRLKAILKKYCRFLTIPIRFNDEIINSMQPLWIKNPKDCSKEDYLAFYHYLYPTDQDPLFWIHLNVDYPFHLKGILYFPKMVGPFDLKKETVQLYCNRVFVDDHCKDIIPEYLTHLKGIIDSPDIPLNVSRSFLQMDRTVRQLGTHISKKVSDTLHQLFKEDREKYVSYWSDVGSIIKIGAIQDEKFFERVKEILIFKTIDGNYVTLDEYREKNPEKIYYTKDEHLAPMILNLYKQKGLQVLVMDTTLDPYIINLIETKLPDFKFQRIDGGVDDTFIDKEKEKNILDAEGKSEQSKMAEFFQKNLESVSVEAKSLVGEHLPGIVLFKEDERRLKEYMKMINPQMPFEPKPTFIVNTNNALVDSIYQLGESDLELSKELVQELYDLSLLGQKEMGPEMLSGFIERSHRVLGKLLQSVKK